MDAAAKKLLLLAAEDARTCKALDLRLQATGYRTQLCNSLSCFWRLVHQEPPFAILIFAYPHSAFAQPWELCQELAGNSQAFRILLVPEHCPKMRAQAFLNRADQCFSLPGHAKEILAYLDTVQMRYECLVLPDGNRTLDGPLNIDLKNRRVYRGDQPIDLTALECALLDVLASREGQIVGYQDLCQILWKSQDPHVARASLKQYIMRLRRKLEINPDRPLYLQTVIGRGYRLQRNAPGAPNDDSQETNGNNPDSKPGLLSGGQSLPLH